MRELGPKELRQATREHIRNVMEHYADDVGVWDVVNEPISDRGGLRPSVFARRLGPGFIEDAFRTARVADRDAKLYLNEIGAEGINPKSNRLYEIVRDLKARGVPIDGVGFQAHANLDGLPADFVANMQRFRALGLDVAITEADVALTLPPSAADLAEAGRDLRADRPRVPDGEVRVADVLGLHRRALVDLRDAGRAGRRDAARRRAAPQAGVRRRAAGPVGPLARALPTGRPSACADAGPSRAGNRAGLQWQPLRNGMETPRGIPGNRVLMSCLLGALQRAKCLGAPGGFVIDGGDKETL